MMQQSGFINRNKCTTLVGVLLVGGCVCVQGVYGNSLYLHLDFTVILKIAPKYKVFLKNIKYINK